MGVREIRIGFWWENLKKRDHLEEIDIDRTTILKCISKEQDERAWT
jgi:hypothetical protein